MSSNKTTNLGLHSWVRSDPFKMDEFNENFDKIDQVVGENKDAVATIPKIAYNTYTGSGNKDRKISLGFTPKIVYVGDTAGNTSHDNAFCGGLALPGKPAMNYSDKYVEIVDGGFQVSHNGTLFSCNDTGKEYRYFAIG